MNVSRATALALTRDTITLMNKIKAVSSVIFFAPAPLVEAVSSVCDSDMVGAQDCHEEARGAYTGGVAASHLYDVGARIVLVGHSECRQRGDDDARIAQKIQRAHEAGLKTILCVGESLSQREEGRQLEVVARQMALGIAPYAIAYEPLWAIGTGRVPHGEEIAAMHHHIGGLFDGAILYGGSVTGDNASELCCVAGVDGLLVGGASLSLDTFAAIVQGVETSLANKHKLK